MRKLKLHELNRKNIDEYKQTPKLPIVIVLDNIRSMYNVGAIFRTCDAFLVKEIFLCGITSKPPHREINKTAIGATESVDWIYNDNIENVIDQLKGDDYFIIGVEQTDNSIPLGDLNINSDKKYALIFGNEVSGLSDSIMNKLDFCVEIPQFGTKHSLNVSIAAGIVIYRISHQLMVN